MRAAHALLAWAALSCSPVVAQREASHWDDQSARELLDAIVAAKTEGLDPRDYSPEPLREAIQGGPGPKLDEAAGERFRHLARDYAQGHVDAEDRLSWFIAGPSLSGESVDALMTRALAERRIGPALAELLPTDSHYLRLRGALAATSPRDVGRLQAIRVNMERWRWLPRTMERQRIEVNVPSFSLTYVAGGQTRSVHRVVVGKPSTPTPQFMASVSAVVFNPWWEIPDSIVAESVGRLVRTNPAAARARGYVWERGNYRQRPGPTNALGQMKLVMPNPFSVYIHDTPTKSLFEHPIRALSHGCIRTDAPLDLAGALLRGQPAWNRSEIERAVSSGNTYRIALATPTPVYVVYFTAEVDPSGKLKTYPDLYGRDKVVAAELVDREMPDDGG